MGTIDTVPLRVPVTDSGYRVPIGFGEDSDSPTVEFTRAGIKLELAVENAHKARAKKLVIVMMAERGQGLG